MTLSSNRTSHDAIEVWPDELPHDPNHRGAGPLPERDLITLCESVTWLTTGKARPSEVLLRLMRRNTGSRRPQGLWCELEEDAVKLVAALRQGDLVAFGQIEGCPHQAIPSDYFLSDVFAEFARNIIAPDPLAFERGTYPEGLPTFRNVRFRRVDLIARLIKSVRPSDEGEPRRFGTIAGQTRCSKWLAYLMRNGPQEAKKSVYADRAIQQFGITQRQFLRAWDNAIAEVQTPDWGRSGRRQKKN